MNANSNGVNMPTDQRGYHHGNLRATLIETGLEALNQNDADGLSLRDVARQVGVSATSVYRHFPDKQAFVDALCAEGSHILARAQRAAMEAAGGQQKGLDASGLAYVRFAIAYPALFRLMNRARPGDPGPNDRDNPAMRELRANIATLLPAAATNRQHGIRALRAWALVHGVAMLVLDGLIPADDALILAIIQSPATP